MIRETDYLSNPRQNERERAAAILAACANKPIRRVTTDMFAYRQNICKPIREHGFSVGRLRSIAECEAKDEQRKLQTKIVSYLLEHGATTGKELAHYFQTTAGKIGNACKHSMIGRREVLNDKHKSRNTLFYIIRGD